MDPKLAHSAYWIGYSEGRCLKPLPDSYGLGDYFPNEYSHGFDDGDYDYEVNRESPIIDTHADPASAYPGKIICTFPLWDIDNYDANEIPYSVYIHDQEETYRGLASSYYIWLESNGRCSWEPF